jgi:two-component system, OmpR family, sensor histidine kinase MprB
VLGRLRNLLSFRAKLVLLTAVAIAFAVVVASVAVWVLATRQLRGQVDDALRGRAQQVALGHHGEFGPLDPGTAVQVIAPDGTSQTDLPILPAGRALAEGRATQPVFSDTTLTLQDTRVHARVYAAALPGGGAVAVWRNVNDTDRALQRIRAVLVAIGAAAIGLGVVLAALVAAAALRPIRRLTIAAERVATTGDLAERVEATSSDELGRMARQFNAMLANLERSVGAQRRLVADASHELRTPLTAVRTNVELALEERLAPADTREALVEAAAELDALTDLVADLVELARGAERKLRMEEVQLDEVVSGVIERVKGRSPGAVFVTSLAPVKVHADPVLIERAVANLIDNALKYSPPHSPIDVTVRDGEVVIQDRGPGIAKEDLPRIFDRFYRAAAARAKPGSGLGLAIVREAAEAHGGTATAESSAYGARFKLALPQA